MGWAVIDSRAVAALGGDREGRAGAGRDPRGRGALGGGAGPSGAGRAEPDRLPFRRGPPPRPAGRVPATCAPPPRPRPGSAERAAASGRASSSADGGWCLWTLVRRARDAAALSLPASGSGSPASPEHLSWPCGEVGLEAAR